MTIKSSAWCEISQNQDYVSLLTESFIPITPPEGEVAHGGEEKDL